MGALYDVVRRRSNLEKAARLVCQKARTSSSKEIRAEVDNFEKARTSRIQNLERALREKRFRFLPQKAVFIPRPGKKPRPIVIAPLPNRIIQRAILEALKDVPKVRDILAIPWSIGGIEGIDKGIALVCEAITQGDEWYLQADIPDFFGSIPHQPVTDFIRAATSDEELVELFSHAVATSIVNISRLTEEELELLPGEETGVAQGSALSALMGNILLSEFDVKMQGQGIRCVRYIDDFIILGQKKHQVSGAFKSAQGLLAGFGIRAYEPDDGSGKARMDRISAGINFLGCSIHGSLVAPSLKARESLIDEVGQVLAEGRKAIRAAVSGRTTGLKGRREAQTLRQVDLIINGWGQAFAFCNANAVSEQLDKKVMEMINRFRDGNARLAEKLPESQRARVYGVTRLADIQRKSIELSPRTKDYAKEK